MSLKKICGLMAFAAVAGGMGMISTARAIAVAQAPAITILENGDPVATGGTIITNGTAFSGSGGTSDFSWSVSGDSDPLINWSFSATAPGTYVITFSAPVVGGPYSVLKNQAALAVSDIGLDGNPTSVTGVSIDGYVPTSTLIPGVTLTGDLVVGDGLTGSINPYGPLTVVQSFGFPSNFKEVLNFTLSSPGGDGSAAFSGQLVLTPEPASLGLLGVGVAGLLLKRKR